MDSTELIQQLENIDDLIVGGGIFKTLESLPKIYNYKALNQMLILLQFPNVQRVAGKAYWDKKNIALNNGEQIKINIVLPNFVIAYRIIQENRYLKQGELTKTELDKSLAQGMIERVRRQKGFKVMPIYDISQMNYEIKQPEETQTGDHQAIIYSIYSKSDISIADRCIVYIIKKYRKIDTEAEEALINKWVDIKYKSLSNQSDKESEIIKLFTDISSQLDKSINILIQSSELEIPMSEENDENIKDTMAEELLTMLEANNINNRISKDTVK